MEKTAVVLGTGNLATHLLPALLKAGVKVLMVYGRTRAAVAKIGSEAAIPFTNEWSQIPDNAHIYLYAVSDNALSELLSRRLAPQALHLHSAGSVGLDVFPAQTPRCGVMYPLQTFSKNKPLDFRQVPLFIEGSSTAVTAELKQLAEALAERVYDVTSAQRRQLHLAAVFACNFVNHLYAIAYDILQSSDLPVEVVRPLIAETASKIEQLSPREAQTGPALRGDSAVMDKHLSLLADHPCYHAIYQLLSDSIGSK